VKTISQKQVESREGYALPQGWRVKTISQKQVESRGDDISDSIMRS